MGLVTNDSSLTLNNMETIMAKPYSNYTLSDIYRLNMSFLKKDRTPDEVAHSASLMAYLVERCKQINCTVILEENFLDHFDRDTFHTLTKQDINKKITEFITGYQAKQAELIGNQLSILEYYKLNSDFASDNISELQKIMKNTLSNISTHTTNYNHYLEEISRCSEAIMELNIKQLKLEQEIEEMSNNPVKYDVKLVKAIEDVLATNKFWYIGTFTHAKPFKYKAIKDGAPITSSYCTYTPSSGSKPCHGFITVEDVVVRHVDQLNGVDKSYNCGKAFIAVNSSGQPSHVRFIANVVANYGAHQHPHVSESGTICWGNALDRVSQRIKDKGVLSMKDNMLTLMALLTTYTPDNPYISMTNLIKRTGKPYANAIVIDEGLFTQYKHSTCPLVLELCDSVKDEYEQLSKVVDMYQDALGKQMTWTSFAKNHPPLEKYILEHSSSFTEAFYSNKSAIRVDNYETDSVIANKLDHNSLDKYKLHPMKYHMNLLGIALQAGTTSNGSSSRHKSVGYIAHYLPVGSKIIYFDQGALTKPRIGVIKKQIYTGNSEQYDQGWEMEDGARILFKHLAMILELGNISTYPFVDFGVQPVTLEATEGEISTGITWEEGDEFYDEDEDEEQEETDDEYYDEEQDNSAPTF